MKVIALAAIAAVVAFATPALAGEGRVTCGFYAGAPDGSMHFMCSDLDDEAFLPRYVQAYAIINADGTNAPPSHLETLMGLETNAAAVIIPPQLAR